MGIQSDNGGSAASAVGTPTTATRVYEARQRLNFFVPGEMVQVNRKALEELVLRAAQYDILAIGIVAAYKACCDEPQNVVPQQKLMQGMDTLARAARESLGIPHPEQHG